MLLGWANRQFGFESNQELLDKLKGTSEGYDSEGRSHVARTLASRDRCMVPRGDLARYDDNVRRHLASINAGRREPITLRYFQQLAALYAELFLDRRAKAPEALAREIHNYVRERVQSLHSTYPIRSIEPRRPEQARVLDGDRQRKDADHASELPSVLALRWWRASGQHHSDHA